MSSKFYSYTDTVDFEGIQLPLPNIYRYITRDERGFIEAWRAKPVRDLEFGGFRSLKVNCRSALVIKAVKTFLLLRVSIAATRLQGNLSL